MGYYISLSMLDGALHLYAHPDIQIVTRNPENQEVEYYNAFSNRLRLI